MYAKPKTWRTLFPVHPAADVFPMMTDDELDKLAEDIKANGLRHSIVLWQSNTEPPRSKLRHSQEQRGLIDPSASYYVLDGRNRLDALDRAGIPVPADWRGGTVAGDDYARSAHVFERVCAFEWFNRGDGWQCRPDVDPVAFVLSLNVHRRHLTKQQQADLIVKTVQASEEFLAKLASEKAEKTSRAGRPRDPVKERAIEEGEKQGIGKRTIERSLAKQEDRPKAPRRKVPIERIVPPLETLAPRVEPLRAAPPPLPIETYEQKLEAKVAKAAEEVRQAALALNYWRRELSEAKAVLKNYQDNQTEEEVA
jgi:hypothetical protein